MTYILKWRKYIIYIHSKRKVDVVGATPNKKLKLQQADAINKSYKRQICQNWKQVSVSNTLFLQVNPHIH